MKLLDQNAGYRLGAINGNLTTVDCDPGISQDMEQPIEHRFMKSHK